VATYTPKRFVDPTQLTTSASTTLYTPSAGATGVIKEIILANPTSTAATASVFLVPSAGTAGNSTAIVPGVTLAGNSFVTIPLSQVLNSTDKISASASAASTITITVSGVEYA
jgi:hypothetical protein